MEGWRWKQVEAIEQEKHMPHLLPFEIRAMERGRKEGRTSALLEAIHDSTIAKFGSDVAAHVMTSVGESTDLEVLKRVLVAVSAASTDDELRRSLPRTANA